MSEFAYLRCVHQSKVCSRMRILSSKYVNHYGGPHSHKFILMRSLLCRIGIIFMLDSHKFILMRSLLCRIEIVFMMDSHKFILCVHCFAESESYLWWIRIHLLLCVHCFAESLRRKTLASIQQNCINSSKWHRQVPTKTVQNQRFWTVLVGNCPWLLGEVGQFW